MFTRTTVRTLACLFAVLAPAAFAIRKSGVGGHLQGDTATTTATHVMRKISLLLKERSHESKAKVRRTMHAVHLSTQRAVDRETPEARVALSSSLQTVIDEIKTTVDAKIQRDHDETQSDIDKKVRQLQTETEETTAKYNTAVGADETWLGCVSEEKGKLEELESAQADLTTAQSEEQAARERKEAAIPFAKEVPASLLSLTCFPAQDAECTSSLQALRASLRQYEEDLVGKIGKSKQTYDEATQALQDAENDVTEKEGQVTQKGVAWRSQRSKCEGQAQEKQRKMCSFGAHLQKKCEKIESYHYVMYLVDETDGGFYSHPDRVEQWTASHLTKCLLEKVISDFQIDSQTLSACEATVNFDADVGVLVRRGDEVQEAAESDAFRCEHTQVSFMGWTWEVPTGVENIKSDQYERVDDWQPGFTVDRGHLAFDFCG